MGSLLREIFFDCDKRSLREAASVMVTAALPDTALLPLLNLAVLPRYRGQSRECFATVKRLALRAELFVPAYIELAQFETNDCSDPDETFIGLMKLIPVTEELVQLTHSRLFAAPTSASLTVPFVHTAES
jgi:hypothetical protein